MIDAAAAIRLRLMLARACAWALLVAGWIGIGSFALLVAPSVSGGFALVALWLFALGAAAAAAAPSANSHKATSAKPPLADGAMNSAKLPIPIQPATSSAHAHARAAVSGSRPVAARSFMRRPLPRAAGCRAPHARSRWPPVR